MTIYLLCTGAVRVVKNEGMPIYRDPYTKGELFVKFDLTFPPQNFASADQIAVSTISVHFKIFCW